MRIMKENIKIAQLSYLFARVVLGVGFLSAVADRLGIWGAVGTQFVDWGNMDVFTQVTGGLAPWCPASLLPLLSWGVTVIEAALGILLLTGFFIRPASFISFTLLVLFAVSMAVFLGPKLVFNYSVLPAAACALMIYAFFSVVSERKGMSPVG